MTGLLTFFALYTWGFWIAITMFIIWEFFIVEQCWYRAGIIDMIVLFVFLQFISRFNILGVIGANPWLWIPGIVGYFIVGTGWSFVKWYLKIQKMARLYKETRIIFLKANETGDLQADCNFKEHTSKKTGRNLQIEWDEAQNHVYNLDVPRVKDYRSEISLWITHWPVSMLWSLMNDFFKAIGNEIVATLRKGYDGIIKKAYGNMR